MTNLLPENSDLEWLKKQAKQRKKALVASGRPCKLADVQFEIAKESGFSSWRSLAAYFEQRDRLTGDRPSAEETDTFLRNVAKGKYEDVVSALKTHSYVKDAVGRHPFWGGRVQAFHLCAEGNREDLFDLLLEAGANVDGLNAEYDFWSPLMLALHNNHDQIAEKLRKAGAVVGICEALLAGDDRTLDTLLNGLGSTEYPRPSGSLIGLCRSPYAVKRLMELGYSLTDKDRWGSDAKDAISRLGPKGRRLLEVLAASGRVPDPRDLARVGDFQKLKEVYRINQSSALSDDVLMAAADFGHVEIAEWLLMHGANVNARHSFGSQGTALHSASWNGDLPMVQCLIQNGAQVDAIDREHETTPFVWAETAQTVTNNPKCAEVAEYLSG